MSVWTYPASSQGQEKKPQTQPAAGDHSDGGDKGSSGGSEHPGSGSPPADHPSYNFGPNNRAYLQRYYARNLGYVNRAHRPALALGGFFPYADIKYITPLPVALHGQLPPPPPGFRMGYYNGYVVVYDPATYFIANVIDLLQ